MLINCVLIHIAFTFYIFSCFINNVTVFFATFLGPILLILAFNVVIFVVVIVVLVKHLIKRSKEQANYRYKGIQLMANITGISCLLGLTWVFGALTITKADQAFQIVFTVTNSLQGFFIFIFFCVLNGDVRLAWKQKLIGKRHTCTTKPTSSMMDSTKQSTKPPSSTELILSHDHVISDQSESFYTNDAYLVDTGGSPAHLTSTFSSHKIHMTEQVELKSVDKAESGGETKAKPPCSTDLIFSHDHVISEQSEFFYTKDAYLVDTGGSPAHITSTFSSHKIHMTEQVELKSVDKAESGGETKTMSITSF